MKKENWISRVQQAEELPPTGSWNSIQSKRRWKSFQKWGIASCSALIIAGLTWGVASHSEVSTSVPVGPTSMASAPTAPKPVQVSDPTKNDIPSTPNAQEEAPSIIVLDEEQETPREASYSMFPYNGSVNSRNEEQKEKEKEKEKESEKQNELAETPTPDPQQGITEFEFVANEIPTMNFFDWSQIPNVFTPNQDGLNDVFSPMESLPTWARSHWAVYKDGQLIKALGTEEFWDGNHASGMEMPSGMYLVELQYLNSQKDSQFSKKTFMVKLMR